MNMKPANNAPAYCSIYSELATVCRIHGYALAIHGSLARDFDLIAIPWIENPSTPDQVINNLVKDFALQKTATISVKLHGRIAYSLIFCGGEACIDISFMPCLSS